MIYSQKTNMYNMLNIFSKYAFKIMVILNALLLIYFIASGYISIINNYPLLYSTVTDTFKI